MSKPQLTSLFGKKISFTASAIKVALQRDHELGDSYVFAADPILVAIYRQKKKGKYTYEVVEMDEQRWTGGAKFPSVGGLTDIIEYKFTGDELDGAVDCFMELVNSPLKKLTKKIPPYIFFRGIKKRRERRKKK